MYLYCSFSGGYSNKTYEAHVHIFIMNERSSIEKIHIKTSRPFICNSYGVLCKDGVLVGASEALFLKQQGELSAEITTRSIFDMDAVNLLHFQTVAALKSNNFILRDTFESTMAAYYPAQRTKKLLENEPPLLFKLIRPLESFTTIANSVVGAKKITVIGDSQDSLLFVETRQLSIEEFSA